MSDLITYDHDALHGQAKEIWDLGIQVGARQVRDMLNAALHDLSPDDLFTDSVDEAADAAGGAIQWEHLLEEKHKVGEYPFDLGPVDALYQWLIEAASPTGHRAAADAIAEHIDMHVEFLSDLEPDPDEEDEDEREGQQEAYYDHLRKLRGFRYALELVIAAYGHEEPMDGFEYPAEVADLPPAAG